MRSSKCVRLAAVLLLALYGVPYAPEPLWPTATLQAAQGTVETQHFLVADTNDEVFTLATVDANSAIIVAIIKNTTANRTFTVTDDTSDTFASVVQIGNFASEAGIQVFADYDVTGGNPVTITVDMSSTGTGFNVMAFELNCPNTCQADTSSSLTNGSGTSHLSSADSTVIDTAADAVPFSVCRASANTTGDTQPTNWEEFTESPDSSTTSFMAFEDDQTLAFTDERGAWTTVATITSQCVIVSVKDSGAGGPVRGRIVGDGIL